MMAERWGASAEHTVAPCKQMDPSDNRLWSNDMKPARALVCVCVSVSEGCDLTFGYKHRKMAWM